VALLALAAPMALAAAAGSAACPSRTAAAEYRLPENPQELLRLDDEMRAFFAARVHRKGSREARIDEIAAAILGEHGLHFRYETGGVYDVREAFRRRRGNCVTYALLVVAVAREFRIPASFNEVAMRPLWDRAGGIVLESRHLNVRVELADGTYEIDLKGSENRREARITTMVVDDVRAFAGMFSNAGVYRLAAGDRVGALRLFELATLTDPSAAFAWSNLGGARALAGEAECASLCYERALVAAPDTMAALSGLAHLQRTAGRVDEAERLERRSLRYREHNPYYLSAVAREEFAAGRLDEARHHLARALRIKPDEPEFRGLMIEIDGRRRLEREEGRRTGRVGAKRGEVVVAGR
jgi:tetratricopeptide (TPR) repeat protein